MTMNKKIAIALAASAMLLIVLVVSVEETDWTYLPNDSPEKIEFSGTEIVVIDEETGEPVIDPETGKPIMTTNTNSLNYALFEKYGPLLLILALLMFGAMIGGVCIAREEVESDDTN
jgi:NADH:ubiquinone oxidoreductase subunit 6 (subunit J)